MTQLANDNMVTLTIIISWIVPECKTIHNYCSLGASFSYPHTLAFILLLLQNATVVLAFVHPKAWLLVFLLVPCYAFRWSLVYFSLVRMSLLLQSFSKAVCAGSVISQIVFFCEALCGF